VRQTGTIALQAVFSVFCGDTVNRQISHRMTSPPTLTPTADPDR
jgi:hypothetical protein